MTYTALYRKFRPILFEEMVGQEHITRTLKNQIISGRVGHAYLFNGGRGTGKTSAAKILARAVNCLNPKDGEPCNECEICKEAMSGSLTDIVEMDAASNNSVEDIRQIRDEVNFLPTKAKYRVYIIDEVHMLSTGAFNALLKTLEEPPEHVKFILATTEPQKLPATILSRCQRFDFKKISEEDISKRLQIVCNESNIEITKEALQTISVLAEGAMRDALSILERCIQDGVTKIDDDKVKDLVGIPKLMYINRIVEAISKYDSEKALEVIEEILEQGKELQNFLWEIIKYVKDILVFKANKKLTIYSEEEINKIKELEKVLDKDRLLSIIYELSNLENEIKWSSQKTILFQVGILKLCNKKESVNINTNSNIDNREIIEMKNKISFLEEQLSKINSNVIHKSDKNVQNTIQNTVKLEESPKPKNISENKPKLEIKVGDKLSFWTKIVNELKETGKIMLYTNLINTTAVEINDMTVGIQFLNGITPFGKTILEKSENVTELEKRISMEYGKQMRIKYIDETQTKVVPKKEEDKNGIEALAKDLDIPFNIIEE